LESNRAIAVDGQLYEHVATVRFDRALGGLSSSRAKL
jgi:hypothetical protein